MGLEEWYYSPPLPPFHAIRPPEEVARECLLSEAGKAELSSGVEVYFRHPSSNHKGIYDPFSRGRVVKEPVTAGEPFRLSVAARLRRGGTASMAPRFADIIPAELVDEGVLGDEYILDLDSPGECANCLAPIPRTSPTGRCADKEACKRRVLEAEDVKRRASWCRLVDRESARRGPHRMATEEYDAIEWAARRIQYLESLVFVGSIQQEIHIKEV